MGHAQRQRPVTLSGPTPRTGVVGPQDSEDPDGDLYRDRRSVRKDG